MKINEWEGSIRDQPISSAEIHQKCIPLSKAITELANQAFLVKVSTSIHKDILSLADVIARIKRNGLKRVDSWIDGPILCPDVHREASSPLEMNWSAINLPSIRSQGVTEVWSQNLYGSEPSIVRDFEGGNMRQRRVLPSNTFKVQNQNFYGSEASIECLYC